MRRTRSTMLFLAFVLSVTAFEARADLNIRVEPSPIQIRQGDNADVAIASEILPGFPETAATIEYTLTDFTVGTGLPATTPTPSAPPASMKIVVNSSTAPGRYTGTIVAVIKDATGSVIGDKTFPEAVVVEVTATACEFQLTSTPQSFRILQGGNARLLVAASLSGGCSGPFSFTAVSPSGLSADGPHVVEAPNTTATFTFTADPMAPAGPQSVEIRVEGGGTMKTLGVPFDVKAVATGDYAIQVDPNPVILKSPTERVQVTITIVSEGGFAGEVPLTIGWTSQSKFVVLGKDCPPHTPCPPFPTTNYTVAAGQSVAETVLISPTGVGGGTLVVQSRAPGRTEKLLEIPVQSEAGGGGTPELSMELPPVIELRAGETTTFPIVTKAEHFSGPVKVQTNAPAGIAIDPPQLTLQAGEATSVTLRVAHDAQPLPAGADLLFITAQGTAGGQLIHKQYQVTVLITPIADTPVRFAVEITPREMEVKPNESGQFTIVARQTEGPAGALQAVSVSNHQSDPLPNDPTVGATITEPSSFGLRPGEPQQVSIRVASYTPPGRYRVRWHLTPVRSDGTRSDAALEDEMIVIVPGVPAAVTEIHARVEPKEASLDPTGIPTIYTVTITGPPGEEIHIDGGDYGGLSIGTLEANRTDPTTTVYKFPISGIADGPRTLTFRFVSRPSYLRGSVTAIALAGSRDVAVDVQPSGLALWPGEAGTFSIGVRDVKGVYKLLVDAVSDSDDVKATLTNPEILPPFTGRVELAVQVVPGAEGELRTVNLHFSDPNAGPTPILVRTVPLQVKVREMDAEIDVEPGVVEVRPGESTKARVTIEGKNGWAGRVLVAVEPEAGIDVEPKLLDFGSLPGSAEIRVSARENLAPGEVSTRLLVRPYGADRTVDDETFRTRVLGPTADFKLSAVPGSLAIQSGSFEKFTVLVDRANGWNGAVDVRIGGSTRVGVEPDRFRIAEGQRTAEIKVSVPAETAGSEGFEPSLMITAGPAGGGDPQREASVALKIRAVPVTAAFTLGSTHDDLWIFASDPARFKVFASGEGQWNGKVNVTARYEHAQPELAGRPDSEIVLTPSTFTLDTADPQAQSREVVISTGPQFSFRRDDMSGSGKFGAFTTKGYRIVFDATPEGGGPVRTLTIPLGTQPFPKGVRVLELVGPSEPIAVGREGRSQFSVELRSLISSPVSATLSATHSAFTITPAEGWGHSRERPTVVFTLEPRPGFGGGTEPILVEARPEGGGSEQVEKLLVPIRTRMGAGKGASMPDDLVEPGSPLVPIEPILPPEFPGVVEGQAFGSVSRIEQTRGYLEGISAGIQAAQPLYNDSEQYDLALGFAQAFDALLNELRSSQPLQVRADEPAIDSVLAARLLQRGLVTAPYRADYQLASLAPHGLFASYIDPETADLMSDIRQGKVNWKDLARKLEPYEILIQQMRAANQSKNIDVASTIANETLADVNARISEKRLDQVPLPLAQVAVKSLALTAAAVATLDLVSKASIAVMPSRVAELYSTVGDVRAHSILVAAGQNPRANLNQPAELAVWMTGQARGGNVVRPSEIVRQIAIPLWAAWGLRGKGKKPGSNDGPSSQDSNRDGQPDWASQEAFEAFLWSELWDRLSMIPVLGQWAGQIGKKFDAQFTIKPFKTGPFRINSDKVVTFKVDNRSEQIVEFSQQGNQPFITGRRTTGPGEEAGYWYGLKGWLISELGNATDGLGLNRKGVVEVVARGPYTDCDEARQEYQRKFCGGSGEGRTKLVPRDAECRFNGVKCDCQCVVKLF